MDRPLEFNQERGIPAPIRSREDSDDGRGLLGSMRNINVPTSMMTPNMSNMMMMNNGMMAGPTNIANNMGNNNMNIMGNTNMSNMASNIGNMNNMSMMGPMGTTMQQAGFMAGNDYEFMMGDPFMMNQTPAGGGGGGGGQEVDGKETLHFNGFILVPPPPHAPPRSTREKPPGCKTLFIGGLPETVTEEMIGELMQTCGNIETIRLGKKHFAHVRFDDYEAVDKAIFYSGWRMKIGDKDDKPNTGRIHCDYATARDDQHEWELMQRAVAREHRHQQRMIEDLNRPPSPPQVVQYSEREASNVSEMLKSSQSFMDAAKILEAWLEKGSVNSRNSSRFYTMLNSVNSYIRRLTGEKEEFERELENYKAQYKTKVIGLGSQMEQIQTVFGKARLQKVWDHLSKPQRKNIDLWIKQCQEVRQRHDDELLADREEDEMDLSDNESTAAPAAKRAKINDSTGSSMNSLKDENDSLKCQLEAYKNELDMNKQENTSELSQKNKQISMLQQTLKGMQEQLVSTRNEVTELQKKFDAASAKEVMKDNKENSTVPTITLDITSEDPITALSPGASEDKKGTKSTADKDSSAPVVIDSHQETSTSSISTESKPIEGAVKAPSTFGIDGECRITPRDGQIMGLIVAFLHVHPFGASADYIWSYLHRGGIEAKSSHIETILETFPNMFKMKMCGVGVNFEKRWYFTGFPNP